MDGDGAPFAVVLDTLGKADKLPRIGRVPCCSVVATDQML